MQDNNLNNQAPIIANNRPAKVSIEEGKAYFFCRCGRSQSQPYCDGSHKGTGLSPLKFTADSTKTAFLCQCKNSDNLPFCDGSHKKFTKDQIGKPAPELSNAVENNEAEVIVKSANTSKQPNASNTDEEPTVEMIHQLAKHGLEGAHGEMAAMGVPRYDLPSWNDIQFVTAQLATRPLLEHESVNTKTIIGGNAKKPMTLSMPIFVSDMSFGALSFEAKVAMSKGAELAGTGICSGEGGMLEEEQQANSHYFYELASAKFGYDEDKLTRVQAFHFKAGQAAKTGTGGHLPGHKVTEQIAKVRGLKAGEDAISPATFSDLKTADDYKQFADRVREVTGGIAIGFKLSAQHIEDDIDFALAASADYIILDGRGGGTGAAPTILRDNISVPTLAALGRARRHLDRRSEQGAKGVSLIITGGLRTAADFAKALALGADAIAVANSAMQAIGCVGARMCDTNMCPAGIATQDPELRKRLNVEKSAQQLANFLNATNHLMQQLARACGHDDLSKFENRDLTSWKKDIAELAGVRFAGN